MTGKVDAAEKVFAKAARWHGVALPDQLPDILRKCRDQAAMDEVSNRSYTSSNVPRISAWAVSPKL